MAILKPGQLASGSYTISGSFSGSFQGSGAGLNNIPSSAIVGLSSTQIASGAVTASVSEGTGSFTVTSGSSTFMFISSSGNVGFRTTTPAYPIDNAGITKTQGLALGTVGHQLVNSNEICGRSALAISVKNISGVLENQLYMTGTTTSAPTALFGIGLSGTPVARLQVRGSGTTSSTTTLLVQNSNASASLAVLDNGFVGIGTSSPLNSLTVRTGVTDDGILLESPTGNPLFLVRRDGNSLNGAELFQYANGVIRLAIRSTSNFSYFNGGNFGFGTPTDIGYRLTISGSSTSGSLNVDNTLYVSGSRVGVGTSAPVCALDITGNVALVHSGTRGKYYFSRDAVVAYPTKYYADGGDHDVNLVMDNSNKISLYDNAQSTWNTNWSIGLLGGNVLINTTTNAGYRLDVNGTARFVNTISYNGNLTPLNASTYSLGLSSSVSISRIINYANNGLSPIQSLEFGFYNTSLNSDGGFSNPTHNNYAFRIYGNYTPSGTGGGTMSSFRIEPTLNFAGNANVGTYRGIWYNPTLTNLTNTNHIAIETVTGNVLFGTTSGNVAIGPTTPSASLHISGASSAALLEIDSPAVNNILFVSGSGRVGIGTGTPSERLVIDGDGVNITDQTNLLFNSRATNASGYSSIIFKNTNTATTIAEIKATVGVGYTNNTLGFFSQGTERMRIFGATGNITIGTTTDAGYRLDVNGNIRGSNNLVISNIIANSGQQLSLEPGASGNRIRLKVGHGLTDGVVVDSDFNSAPSTGDYSVLRLALNFAPTSGNSIKNYITVNPTINQTGGANGITRGLYVNPTLTSAADFRAIETTTGSVIFGGNTTVTVTGSATISNVLTLTPQNPLPSGVPTGSFAVSSSVPPKPFFWDGTTWNALY